MNGTTFGTPCLPDNDTYPFSRDDYNLQLLNIASFYASLLHLSEQCLYSLDILFFPVNDLSTGHVGAPLQCCEFMLVDWIEGKICYTLKLYS